MRVIVYRILFLTAAALLLLSGCAQKAVHPLKDSGFASPAPADEAERACLDFVQKRLIAQGGVHTNYLGGSSQGNLAEGHEVLGESQGLMLRYYASTSNTQAFSQTLNYVVQTLDTGTLLSYRVREDGSCYAANAALDDLRILRGLIEGAQAFSQFEYRAQYQSYGERLYQTNVQNDILLDCYDETLSFAGRVSTLCFSDLETMHLLGTDDKRWTKVEKKMRGILKKGYLDDNFPLFQTRYYPDSETYATERVNMVEALLTALHLSQVDECPATTVRWVKEALTKGVIYGEYTPQGQPSSTIESTAIYALCALLGDAEGDRALTNAAMEKMRALQITDKQSVLYGAFADAATLQAYSFDNLMALTALRVQAKYVGPGEKGGGI
ncbi:MAG TPA: hypothetical protein VN626_09020 [Clostridia bacterium]|nr:hypothetical protein [Clostridia bacterium]